MKAEAVCAADVCELTFITYRVAISRKVEPIEGVMRVKTWF